MSSPDPTQWSSRLLELRFDVRAVLAEREVPLSEVLEYGVGSVIDLGSADSIEARVRLGDSEIGRGSIVVIAEAGREPGGVSPGNEEATDVPPRFAVRFDQMHADSIDGWRGAIADWIGQRFDRDPK
ncbi:MAG: FliM/FliN family flagellar motor switch protein [Planctomycetes bacterium]|nr:FliM/FliN family flagellar motor switch protein [Planctomycetota bacterium]